MANVWDATIAGMIGKFDEPGPGSFGGRKITVDGNVVRLLGALGKIGGMLGDNRSATTFEMPKGKGAKTHRTAFLGSVIGALADRSAVWGALFNYPRTVIIGPDAAFSCTSTARGYFAWNENIGIANDKYQKLRPRDVDQIIWLNHCPEVNKGYPPVIEIGVLRLNHESQVGGRIVPTLGATRLLSYEGKHESGYAFDAAIVNWDGVKKAEAEKILAHLFEPGTFVDTDRWTSTKFTQPTKPEGEEQAATDYVRRCASVLERLMRDRTTPLREALTFVTDPKLEQQHVSPDMMYKAVGVQQVPYALDDLDADKAQPPVMPGATNIDEIVGVLKNVIVGEKGTIGTGISRYDSLFDDAPAAAAFSSRRRAANPYDSLIGDDFDDSDSDDDDNNAFAGGELSPFSCSEDEYGY